MLKIESSLDKKVELTIDISGSDGAYFIGPQDAASQQKTVSVPPFQKMKVCQLKLRGDWNLKIRFTYTVEDVTEEEAEQIKLIPTRTAEKQKLLENSDEEEQKQEDLGGQLTGKNAEYASRSYELFKTMSVTNTPQLDIQDFLAAN